MASIFPPPVPNYAVLEVQDLLEQATKLKARALELGEWVWEDIVEALGLRITRKKPGRRKGAVNKKDAAERAVLMNRYEVEKQKTPRATDVKISKRLAKDRDLCRQLDIKGTATIRAGKILRKIRSAKKRWPPKRLLEKADPRRRRK